jgi:predicted MPP superfamily phosphohydrolase
VESIVHYLKHPNWRSQHFWRKAIWRGMARLGLTGLHALPVNRRWIDIHRRQMPLRNLDGAFVGMKVVQLSDLHYSPVVWERYLVQYTRWINNLKPDLVVVTGDLITGGYRFAHRVATILSHLKARHGVICTFGNHDYSLYGRNGWGEGERRADYLEKCLEKRGLIVLRNETHLLKRDGCKQPLAIVGLDDEWSGHQDARQAFDGLDARIPIICLNHNPANCIELMDYPWQWMLAGHTHGRQLATTRFGKTFYPHRHREYTHGHYAVKGRHLYVNRGISYGQRIRDWCRPEITVFRLVAEEG